MKVVDQTYSSRAWIARNRSLSGNRRNWCGICSLREAPALDGSHKAIRGRRHLHSHPFSLGAQGTQGCQALRLEAASPEEFARWRPVQW